MGLVLQKYVLRLKSGVKEEGVTLKRYIPKAPAIATLHQVIAISPPGGRCAAVPRGGGGLVVDDIGGSGSSVLAIRGRVVNDRGCTCE